MRRHVVYERTADAAMSLDITQTLTPPRTVRSNP